MKIELINKTRIKVNLNKEESELLMLDYKNFNYTKESTKKALDIILYKIEVINKIKLPKETTIVNAYPYIDCGILIIVEQL